MIDYKYSSLFQQGSVEKDWKIEYDGGEFTDWELFEQRIELTENLCSERELRFGCCEASVFKFMVGNIVKPLMGQQLIVTLVLDHNDDAPFTVGRYKVASDKPTADRQHREIVAYDAMYDIINTDVADWYNSVLPDKTSKMTLQQFRTKFIQYFGLEEVVPEGGLVNDDMLVERTIDPEQISGRDVITAICEINGCFGHIGRNGKFHYIYLSQAIEGLYPSKTLFPDHAPDHLAQALTGHLYPQSPKTTRIESDVYISGDYENYVVKSITKLQIRKGENDIGKIWPETPIDPNDNCYIIEDNFLVYGKSTDQLREIATNLYEKIKYVTYRPFTCETMGNLCFEVGDPIRLLTKNQIIETYILKRTLKGIQALRDSYSSSGKEQYSENVNGVQKSIIDLKGKSNVLERTIEETRIEMRDIENDLQAQIKINAEQIQLRVRKGEVSSEISQEAGKITIRANRISIQSDYFKLTEDGRITSTSGSIGGISIGSNGISAANFSIDSEGNGTFRSINIQSGTIGGISIGSNGISATNFSIDSGGNGSFRNISIQSGAGSFSTGFGVIGMARNQLDEIVADNATLNTLISQRAYISDLNALSARLGTVEANYISAATVKTDYMEVANWTIAGKIRADKIDWESAVGITLAIARAAIYEHLYYQGTGVKWRNIVDIYGVSHRCLVDESDE